jgi:hypothetical protein
MTLVEKDPTRAEATNHRVASNTACIHCTYDSKINITFTPTIVCIYCFCFFFIIVAEFMKVYDNLQGSIFTSLRLHDVQQ